MPPSRAASRLRRGGAAALVASTLLAPADAALANGVAAPAAAKARTSQEVGTATTRSVAGRVARLRSDGTALAPRDAPAAVRAVIAAYGTPEHAYLEVAGLRLDTSSFGDPGGLSGVRWRPAIGARPGFVASHPGTL
jgi:hypothetical protein